MNDEVPSQRLLDQRLRNRIMEAIETLADGNDGVRREWPAEYFEMFYDCIPHRDDGAMHANQVIPVEERASLADVSRVIDDASDATPGNMTAEEFIATGWPDRIRPFALRALQLMRSRGRFSEVREEDTPAG